MSMAVRRHDRRGRSARRPAERGARGVDGRQDCVRRSPRARAGLPVIEVSAFVSPKWVPQMADAAEVFAGITRRAGPVHRARAEPRRSRARARRRRHARSAIFAAASETFSRKNINQAIDAIARRPIARSARARSRAGMRVRGYLSTAFGCPFEGDVAAGARRRRRGALVEHGRLRGRGQRHDRHRASRPGAARARRRRGARAGRSQVALHFHDTRGTALANVLAALDYGVTTFDASAGGLGGCPYAPGATGQPRHRGSALHAGRARHRHRRQSRRAGRGRMVRGAAGWSRAPLSIQPGLRLRR